MVRMFILMKSQMTLNLDHLGHKLGQYVRLKKCLLWTLEAMISAQLINFLVNWALICSHSSCCIDPKIHLCGSWHEWAIQGHHGPLVFVSVDLLGCNPIILLATLERMLLKTLKEMEYTAESVKFKQFNPFTNKPFLLCVCSTTLLKTLLEKEKLLVKSNFSFSHSVFYPFGELFAILFKVEIVVCKLFQFWKV